LEIKLKSSTDAGIYDSKTFKIFYIIIWLFLICLLLGIPIMWWAVIKKTIPAGGG